MFLIIVGFLSVLMGSQSARPQKGIPAIAKDANGAVVSIVMSDKDGHSVVQGTGFLVSTDGRVVTNYHVIEHGTSAVIKLPDGAFFVVDGVLAIDKARDIAVIKAHGNNFRTVSLGDSDRLEVGEEVVAIGNPLSLESTVSNGILSGVRSVEKEGGKFLQITAPVSPGSSGGPLFNMAGEVVGITTLHVEGGENLNFAIPINDVKPMLQTSFSALANFPDKAKAGEATPSGLTTAHVIGIERTIITLPGYTIPDYATCVKVPVDMPDDEVKKVEYHCKELDKIRKSLRTSYVPPRKESGYMVTFETATARYVVSTVGRCTQWLENGECGGEVGVDVVVGQLYTFYLRAGDTVVLLTSPPGKDDFLRVADIVLRGHLESVVEKRRAE